MLIRHSLVYLVARGLPGLVNLAALALYSRLLNAEEFGRYSLVIAGVSMASVIVFQWQWLVLARWLPSRMHDSPRYQGEVLWIFLRLALATTALGVVVATVWLDALWQHLVLMGVGLLIAQSWLELNLTIASAQLQPTRYGRILGTKTLVAIGVGSYLAWIGLGAAGPLLGLIIGGLIAVPIFGWTPWLGVRPVRPAWTDLRAQLHYGVPLIATFALAWVIAGSDRILIASLISVEAAGQYAVGYDLAQQSLGAILAVAQVAAYPLIVRALETNGAEAATEQMRKSAEMIVALSCAGAAGLFALGDLVAASVVGAEFEQSSMMLIPWVALSTALMGVKTYHFDLAFHLGRNSRLLVGIGLTAAVANVALNLVLIPRFGLLGAVYATVCAYSVGLTMSALLGKRLFKLPPFAPILLRSISIALVTAAAASLGPALDDGLVGLGIGLTCGLTAAIATAFAINLAGLRHSFRQWRAGTPSNDAGNGVQ